jgi:hypothetical protein
MPHESAILLSNKKPWTRTDLNFWLDVVLLVLFCLLGWTSAVVYYAFPPGPQADGWTVWRWRYDQWADLQFTLLCLLVGAIVVHLMLHWTWIYSVARSKLAPRGAKGRPDVRNEGNRTLWGVMLLIVTLHLIGLGVAAAILCAQPPTS